MHLNGQVAKRIRLTTNWSWVDISDAPEFSIKPIAYSSKHTFGIWCN